MVETPKPQEGCWTLIAPDGRQWLSDSPLRCASLEQRERVPAAVAMDRILAAVQEDGETEAKADRDRFHLWALSKELRLRRDDGDNGYFYTGTREAWWAWCEALRLERSTLGKGSAHE